MRAKWSRRMGRAENEAEGFALACCLLTAAAGRLCIARLPDALNGCIHGESDPPRPAVRTSVLVVNRI